MWSRLPTDATEGRPAGRDDRPLEGPSGRTGQELALVEAALRCVARFGFTKTSLEDVAREARCSRATVYRVFPGGKDALAEAVVSVEADRLFGVVAAAVDSSSSLEEGLTGAMCTAARWLGAHRALQFMLAHEPEVVLPLVSFGAMDELLALVRARLSPHFVRWLGDDAGRVVEWAARLVLSYAVDEGGTVDISSAESVRSLVGTFVLPGLPSLAGASALAGVGAPARAGS
jgi:AcrR family transcriptional regulator